MSIITRNEDISNVNKLKTSLGEIQKFGLATASLKNSSTPQDIASVANKALSEEEL